MFVFLASFLAFGLSGFVCKFRFLTQPRREIFVSFDRFEVDRLLFACLWLAFRLLFCFYGFVHVVAWMCIGIFIAVTGISMDVYVYLHVCFLMISSV